jgi:hypothetical protein
MDLLVVLGQMYALMLEGVWAGNTKEKTSCVLTLTCFFTYGDTRSSLLIDFGGDASSDALNHNVGRVHRDADPLMYKKLSSKIDLFHTQIRAATRGKESCSTAISKLCNRFLTAA